MRSVSTLLWPLCLLLVVSCGAGQSSSIPEEDRVRSVFFSIANQLTRFPAAQVDVTLDGTSVFHGAVMATGPGNYIYLRTGHPRALAEIRVVFETPEGRYYKEKVVGIQDRTWIVVALVEHAGDIPELDVQVTYEQPAATGDFN